MILVDREELYKEFRKDNMGGLNWERILRTAKPWEIIHCKDCRWGREVSGNIECFVDSNIPPEYHGYEWFCPNGERKDGDGNG